MGGGAVPIFGDMHNLYVLFSLRKPRYAPFADPPKSSRSQKPLFQSIHYRTPPLPYAQGLSAPPRLWRAQSLRSE